MARKHAGDDYLPGMLRFSLNNDTEALECAKRSRFEPERRKQVADVRAKGACLRCRLMKVPCSGARPCERCVNMAQSRRSSSYLWISCMPSALAALKDFFRVDEQIPATTPDFALNASGRIALQLIDLEFENHIKWDIEDLSGVWAECMNNTAGMPQTSAVGVMSSFQLQQLLTTWIPDVVCMQFRLLIYTSSLIYNLGHETLNVGHMFTELVITRSRAGNALLESLEKILRPGDLAKASPKKLRAIFMILFGTILAVLYSGSFSDKVVLRDPQSQEALRSPGEERLRQMQEQLIRLLAHRMIDIADRLGLYGQDVSRKNLIESAQSSWHLPAAFTWTMRRTEASNQRGKEEITATFAKDQRAEVSRIVPSKGCILCARYIKVGSGSGSVCNSCMSGRRVINPSLSMALDVKSGQAVYGETSPLGPRNPPRCGNCRFIIPEGMTDDLCYTCTGLNFEHFGQDSVWPQSDPPGYAAEDLVFNSPSVPNSDLIFYGDNSGSFLSTVPIAPASFASDSIMNQMEEVTACAACPILKNPSCFEMDRKLNRVRPYTVCGRDVSPLEPIVSIISGYLV